MDKRKVRTFKNQQERLAKKIAEAHGSANFTINYEQTIPNAYIDWETKKLIIRDNSQFIFPTTVTRKGVKHRLIVIMRFQGTCESRTIGKILRRQFLIKSFEDGFEIWTSFNPHTIAKL